MYVCVSTNSFLSAGERGGFVKYSTVDRGPHPPDAGAAGGLVLSRDGSSAVMDVSVQLRPAGAGLRLVRPIWILYMYRYMYVYIYIYIYIYINI